MNLNNQNSPVSPFNSNVAIPFSQLVRPDLKITIKEHPFPYFFVDDFIEPKLFETAMTQYAQVRNSIAWDDHPDDPDFFRPEEPMGLIERIGGRNLNTHFQAFEEIRQKAPAFGAIIDSTYSYSFTKYFIDLFAKTASFKEYFGDKKVTVVTNDYRVSLLESKFCRPMYSGSMLSAFTNNAGLLPHTDRGDKVISLLLQLAAPGWTPDMGGGLRIFSSAKCPEVDIWSRKDNLADDQIKRLTVVEDIHFGRNRLIGFLKTFNSWHGVPVVKCPAGVWRETLQININQANNVTRGRELMRAARRVLLGATRK